MPRSLLFIEDNEDILLNLFAWFEDRGFSCDCARNGCAGLDLAVKGQFDCIALDVMLPRLDGIEVCKRLRSAGVQTPVIMLTAKDAVEDRITGLESGADDYLVKPFALKELEARILAILRRGRHADPVLHYGDLALDRAKHMASRCNVELRLTPTGFRILEALITAAPAPVRRQELETMIWGDSAPDGSALRNHIHELRKILDVPFNSQLLETMPKVGWRLKVR